MMDMVHNLAEFAVQRNHDRCIRLEEQDIQFLKPILQDFVRTFKLDVEVLDFSQYCKILPVSTRPATRATRSCRA